MVYQWTIQKTLSQTDISHADRVLLPKKKIESAVVQFLNQDEKEMLEAGKAVNIYVVDHNDNKNVICMKLRIRGSTAYLEGGWRKMVQNENLSCGDLMQLYYDIRLALLHIKTSSVQMNHGMEEGAGAGAEADA